MKAPKRYIKASQGYTTAVFAYKVPADNGVIYTRGVKVIHKPLRPVLFHRGRVINEMVCM